jgi:DNA (cytosine-5)-methyltransferase 3A
MNVLSLFDGMSCGQQALERTGIKVDKYFASEIDKYAMQVTMANYPNTIQLGSVVDVDGYSLPKIDLLIGGSPCQSFSFAGKRKGMSTKDEQEILTLEHYLQLKSEGYEFEGQSYLFWEYMRLLNEVKPKYFLLENVMMGEKWEKVLSKAIGVKPIEINSALVSAQNRRRLYWTNIGMRPAGLFGDMESIIEQPKDLGILLKDILQDNPNAKYYLSKKMIEYVTKSGTKNFYYKPEFLDVESKAKPITTKHIHRAGTTNYFCEPIDEKYYLSQDQTDKVLDKTGVDSNVDEPKILDVYNNKIKEDGKSITLTDPCHNNLRLIEPIPVDEKYFLTDKRIETIKKSNRSVPPLTNESEKHNCLIAGYYKTPTDGQYIVHNTMPRSSTSGKGGTGQLSRNDGKTYCLDTGTTNAVEIIGGDFRYDEGFRWRENGKSPTLCLGSENGLSGNALTKINSRIRRLTPIECERLQTVPDNYTNYVSDSQRYKMLGNGWTVDVIAHIFGYMK